MNCLPCFNKDEDEGVDQPPQATKAEPPPQAKPAAAPPPDAAASSKAKAFNFRELAMATRNFRQECLIGEGGFGRVFKGKLQATGQVVAVKQLDRNGMQGNKEFLDEVLMLSLYEHPNLITLIGYCADGDQRLLVFEFMEMGSLENHLFGDDPEKKQMDWYTRMKIASGVAGGLEYMHDTANPSMIYRDLKPSNILLTENYEPKLSDYGLAKLGAGGDGKMNQTSRVMATYGYSAPEYSSSGELTLKSDIYSFGVVLLELITGRRAIDTNRPNDEQNLVTWAQPIFREPKRFIELADPRLNKEFPVTGLNQAVGICAMCLQEESCVRPLASDVVAALSFLSVPLPNAVLASSLPAEKDTKAVTPPPEQKMKYDQDVSHKRSDKDGSSDDTDDNDNDNDNDDDDDDDGSGGESSHYSEEESEYSDSDGADESDNDDDVSEDTNKKHGGRSGSSSKRGLSTKKTSSKQRKMVVTFKEPNSSSKRNDGGGDDRRHTSSSSSDSGSESDGEKGEGDKQKSKCKKSKEHRGKSVDMGEGRGRKLQHLKTR